jgi:hypothetical protein
MSGGEVIAIVSIVIGAIVTLALMRGMTAWRFWQDTVVPWIDSQTGRSPRDDDKPT